MTEEQRLSVREAARLSKRNEETVRRWIWSGKLRAQKLGGQYFIDRAVLDAVLGRRPASAEGAPRVAEPAAVYSPAPVEEGYDMDKNDDARKWLKDVLALGDRVAAAGKAVDVVDLIDEAREGLA
jgi:excisionase family DNA binding protein